MTATVSPTVQIGKANEMPPTAAQHDGQHDFDFEFGSWKTRLKRLAKPLTGSKTWLEYEGTSVVRKLWDGRANVLELEVDDANGQHIEGLSLRLYDPQSRQWSLNFANSKMGTLTSPTIGGFTAGRGEFYGQDTLDGRLIFVRFIIDCSSATSCHFEQAFSDNGGRTWEVNWIADDTKIEDRPASGR